MARGAAFGVDCWSPRHAPDHAGAGPRERALHPAPGWGGGRQEWKLQASLLGLSQLFQGARGRKFLGFQACRIIAERNRRAQSRVRERG